MYWISGSHERSVTKGAASFLTTLALSDSAIKSVLLSMHLTAAKITAGLLCWSLGKIRSIIFSAS